MSRHAKNNTASSYFTYHERQRLDYGTKKQRLGKDSLQQFDCCCLTLLPPSDPVVTPHGYLYSREALLENLLAQKQEIARKLMAYEDQQKEFEQEAKDKAVDARRAEVAQFEAIEGSLLPVSATDYKQSQEHKRVTEAIPNSYRAQLLAQDRLKVVDRIENDAIVATREDPAKVLKAFWVPGVQEEAKRTVLTKPTTCTLDPKAQKPLRVKQLVRVQFTPLVGRSEASSSASTSSSSLGTWMCPLCYSALSNKVPLAVLKTSGKILCRTCVDNLVLPEMRDPLTSKPVRKKDVIYLKSGGTGYAGKEGQENLIAEKFGVAFQ